MTFRNVLAQNAIRIKTPMVFSYTKKAMDLFYGNKEVMRNYQKAQQEKLFLYAYEHTKYYKEIFDEIQFVQKGNIAWDRYKQVPVLTKDIIRRRYIDLVSDEHMQRKSYTNTSGGSTGEPVKFLQDKEYFEKNFANKILFGLLNRKAPGDKEVKIWGSERDILEGTIGIKEKIINYVYNRELLNSFILTQENIPLYIEAINKNKPLQIWAYADSMYQLARYINENQQKVYMPHSIVCTAGMLYDDMRDEIQRAFQKSYILNQYGSREVGAIGIEVEGIRGIRLFEHFNYVEVEDNITKQINEIGEGQLVVTNLANYSMPIIRYIIGDEGVIEGEQGSGCFRTLTHLKGRQNAHFKKLDGSIVHGEYFTHLFYGKEWIENFQVIQKDYKKIEFLIVKKANKKENQADIEEMISAAKNIMGQCEIEVKYREKINRLASGKYQFVISEVK